MQTTLTVPVKNAAQVNAIMAIVGQDQPAATEAPKAAPKTSPKKNAAPKEVEETSDIDMSDLRDETMTEVGNDDPADFDENFDDAEPEAPKVISADTLKTKLLPALNAYTKKHGKDKAVKILKTVAPTSKEVKEADLPKLLKLLKV